MADPRYLAHYVPEMGPERPDADREFATEDEAWAYVFDQMCDSCIGERALALKCARQGLPPDRWRDSRGYPCELHPYCSSEWRVAPVTEGNDL
jgi:hypothetical protein